MKKGTPVTHIHVASIHFGNNTDGSPYIHLNNYPPNDKRFDSVWEELREMEKLGVEIVLMMGGAGGAYSYLFEKFDVYYPMLKETIISHPVIKGIDLDIEEYVSLDNVKKIINQIDNDFGDDFIISMAPVQGSLQEDVPGMGGFIYKKLYESDEGKRINYFNGQFYGDYSVLSYQQVVENGYPSEKVVMGMVTGQNLMNNLGVMKQLCEKYKCFGGVYNWEYFNSPPDGSSNPGEWADLVDKNFSNLNSI